MNLYAIYLTLLTVVGLLGCLAFIGGYWWTTRGRWVREEAGRFLMTIVGSIGGLLTILLLNQWLTGNTLWADVFRRPITAIVSTAFVVSLWWPLRLLWLAEDERRRRSTSGPRTG